MASEGLRGPSSTRKLTEDSSASSTLNSSADTLTLDNGDSVLTLRPEHLHLHGTHLSAGSDMAGFN